MWLRADRKWAVTLGGVIAFAAFALARPSRADPPDGLAARFSYGAQQIALLAGGGFGIPVLGGRDRPEDHERIFGVFGRWGVGVSDPLARDSFVEGNLELDLEPMVLLNSTPRTGWAAGGSLLLHYNFLGAGAIVPFIEGGSGASRLAFHLRDQADGFAFPLQASLGFHLLAFTRGAITASVGYYHLSNAGLRYPNLGVNAVMIRLGVTAFLSNCARRGERPRARRRRAPISARQANSRA